MIKKIDAFRRTIDFLGEYINSTNEDEFDELIEFYEQQITYTENQHEREKARRDRMPKPEPKPDTLLPVVKAFLTHEPQTIAQILSTMVASNNEYVKLTQNSIIPRLVKLVATGEAVKSKVVVEGKDRLMAAYQLA